MQDIKRTYPKLILQWIKILTKIRLYSKVKEQMNAHSAYRNLKYQVNNVKPMNSENNISVQIIDIVMGMTVFLMEGLYKKKQLQPK